MEARNRLTVTRGESEGDNGKEGFSQGTDIKDPWAWTTGWGLTVGVGVGQAGENNRRQLRQL